MSKLFEAWSWNRPHISPFSGYAKALLRRSDVSTRYFAGKARQATVHPLIMQAVQMYLELELGNRASGQIHEGAIGSQGNDITVAEYPSSSGELQVIIFNRNTGKFSAGRYPDPIAPTAKPTAYSYAEAGNSGTALFFALLPTFLGDSEFNQAYQDYKAQATTGFPDDDATSKAAALMCDNMYRRIEYASGLGADGVNVVIPAGGAIPAIRALDIKRGTYLPTNTLAGQFEIMVDTNATGSPKATIAINDFVGKYVLDESRVLTSEEELSVPVLPDWYLIPPEVKIICEHAKGTTGTSHAMRNFMMRGPAGTGKTEGAKAIAAALHLPYRFITCSANTEVFDLIGQILPATEENKEDSGGAYPSLTDIQMDPASAYYMLTGTYEDEIDEFTVYKTLLKKVRQDGEHSAAAQNGSNSFHYVDTPLVEAIRNGYVLELQEPTCIANPAVLVGLNGLLDQCKSITLPTGETVERHPDTVTVITTNVDYAGCRGMNQSIISRMNLVIDLDEPDEQTLVKRVMGVTGCKDKSAVTKMAQIVHKIHEYCQETSIRDGCCGVRELIAWVQSYMIIKDISEAAKYTVLSSASSDASCRKEIEDTCMKTLLAA